MRPSGVRWIESWRYEPWRREPDGEIPDPLPRAFGHDRRHGVDQFPIAFRTDFAQVVRYGRADTVDSRGAIQPEGQVCAVRHRRIPGFLRYIICVHFTELIDLAAERLGGAALTASDEFFAPKENLLKAAKPVWREGEFTDRGKWMDGWETRRRRGVPAGTGQDWCIIRLGLPGTIQGIVVDTSHFKGNYPEACSLEACAVAGHPDAAQLAAPAEWVTLLPKAQLRGDEENAFPIEHVERFTHLRFNIFPDGGVARLRVYGTVVPDWGRIARNQELDLAVVENGGLVAACSDMFFGHRHHLILPGPALNMGDGWETRRRRGPGHDWAIIKLGARGLVERVEVDTTHFKGNAPESCWIEGMVNGAWKELLPRQKVEPHTRHFFHREIQRVGAVTHVRFNIFPDGGVARLRVMGKLCRDGLERLNALASDEVRAELMECCGSARWAKAMTAQRPFETSGDLFHAADEHWRSLAPSDWLEAFGTQSTFELTAGNSSQLAELEKVFEAYRERFPHTLVCDIPSGSIDEFLAAVRPRLANDRETELRVAAEEQRKIIRHKLEKLVSI
jgi:allantoicase